MAGISQSKQLWHCTAMRKGPACPCASRATSRAASATCGRTLRASDKSQALLEAEGPQIIQAGAENATSTSVKEGFHHHRGAWFSARDYQVVFFAHALP